MGKFIFGITFISMPMNHPDKAILQERILISKKLCYYYFKMGITAISPGQMGYDIIEHVTDEVNTSFTNWEKYCLDLLKESTYVTFLLLDGFEYSSGMKKEYNAVDKMSDLYMIEFMDYVDGRFVEASEEKIKKFVDLCLK